MLDSDKLNDLRQRVLAGEELSTAEYSQVLQAYRAQRLGAGAASAEKTRAKVASAAKAAPVDLNTLMASIGLPKAEGS